MVRNTGAQSAASRGYGSAMVMSSTVSSGIVATEGYFLNTANADAMLGKINDAIAGNQPYIYIENGGRKKLAKEQFFSSQLVAFDKDSKIATFDIKSGKNAKGKAVDSARVFYTMDVELVGGNYGAKNAVRFNCNLSDGNNGMEVTNGSATFEKSVKFQNAAAIFHGDAFFNEDVEFANSGYGNKFYDKAYFGGNSTFRAGATNGSLFNNDVGFNGNISTGGVTSQFITSDGNVYLNGNFGNYNPYNPPGGGFNVETGLQIKSNTGNKNFYYTDNLSTIDNVTGFQNKTNMNSMAGNYILNQLHIVTLESRKDPEIEMNNIPAEKIQSAASAATTSGGNFSVLKLEESYKAAKEAGTLYNGHLVLKVKSGDPNINFPSTHALRTQAHWYTPVPATRKLTNSVQADFSAASSTSTKGTPLRTRSIGKPVVA